MVKNLANCRLLVPSENKHYLLYVFFFLQLTLFIVFEKSFFIN